MNQPLSLADRKRNALEYLESELKRNCPIKTGNLSRDHIVIINDNSIGIGGENAHYAAATNEPWTSPRWHGRKNPNEGWINRTIEACLPYIKQIYSGTIAQEEVDKMIEENRKAYQERINERIKEIEKE